MRRAFSNRGAMGAAFLRSCALIASVGLLGACGLSDSTGTFHTLVVLSDNGVLDAIGATVALTAVDSSSSFGTSTAPLAVTWTSSDPTIASVSAANGPAIVTAKKNGSVTITATSGALAGSFQLTVAQVARSLAIVSGDGQGASVSTLLPQPLVVRALDRLGSGVPQVAVLFAPEANSGTVAPTGVTTGPDGTASTRWTFGSTQGTQKVDAISLLGATVTFTGKAGP